VPRRMLLSTVVLVGLALPATAVAAPVAHYRVRPARAVVGHAVRLDASATRCDHAPCRYRWARLEHGEASSLGRGKVVTVKFAAAGVKAVRLTVRNKRGAVDTVRHLIKVRRARPLAAPPSGVVLPVQPSLPLPGSPASPVPDPGPDPSPTPTPPPVPDPSPTPTPPPVPDPTPTPEPSTCTKNATSATFSAVFSAAQAGDVICLASGSYGTFSGARKTGRVTIRPQDGAAVTMNISWTDTPANITVDGVTIPDMDMEGPIHDLTIQNSAFTGCSIIRTPEMANANVLLDHNTFLNVPRDACLYDGRLAFPQRNENAPSGVTVANNLFSGGNADGILNGSNGTRIIGNEFSDIRQTSSDAHTDSIQLYGSKNTLIQGNYFHGSDVDIMAPDGGDHEMVVDNVFVGIAAYRPAIQFGAHIGTQFIHNTVRGIDVHMDSKDVGDPSRNGILRDNVMMNSSFNFSNGGGCVNCQTSNNLMSGAVFVGGSNPTTYAGHKLADGSPGKGAATDGADQGARIP
jgi:hypothetical protein